MISPDRLASMRTHWLELLGRWHVPADWAAKTFEQLAAAYSSPDRAYHNLEHLAEMFDILKRLAPTVDDSDAVQMAVWFHDAVYDTHRNDKEERSAQLAGELLGPLGVPPAVVERVQDLVRATAHRPLAGPLDSDTAALLDADLAILGAAPERYSRYARDVRLEYRWVPEADYRRGRADVLQQFLARPRIFHHTILREEGEVRARQNMLEELESL